ncbi:uncharacterized protein LOC124361462 [Homalodisca vitripennis]|uniref:uncharacterized protein LOC124361462 n=1 Tax=Homalodisca vitripennis TaxID=197043 RepID=UPI001EEB9A35|nr:uncharacterized protein LOC124361462 [Homalodisca vitripennis]
MSWILYLHQKRSAMLTTSLLLLPVLIRPALSNQNVTTTAPSTSPADFELTLPSPSLLQRLYDVTSAVFQTDSESNSRQGPIAGGIRLTLGALLALLLATIIGVVGFGSVGLLAAKALSIATLALFLAVLSSFKKHKSDSHGQTVHYVPIHSNSHEFFHERGEYLPPYLDRKA